MTRLLNAYVPVCDAIAALFHPNVEVVLHDLASQRIAYIANAYSKRRAGESSLNEPQTAFAAAANVIGPYEKVNWDGRRLKSITAVIRSHRRKAIGLLCINYDVEVLTEALTHIRSVISVPSRPVSTKHLMSKDWREGVHKVVGSFLGSRKSTLVGLTRADMDDLIDEIDGHGIFDIRKAVPYVATLLKLSRATIYTRLAGVRERRTPGVARPRQKRGKA